MDDGGAELDALLSRAGLGGAARIEDTPLVAPPLHALSLAIAQKCNLGSSYCYAQQGEFGGPARNMTPEVAERAVDRLIEGAQPGARLTLAGGEPLVNREALRSTTLYAMEGERHLLWEDLHRLFRAYGNQVQPHLQKRKVLARRISG